MAKYATFHISRLIQSLPFISILFIFSYVPVILFGSSSGTNIDGSLIYAVVVLLVFTSLPLMYRNRALLLSTLTFKSLVAFAIFASLSIAWGDNTLRGVATASFIVLMAALVAGGMVFTLEYRRRSHNASVVYKAIGIATGLMCGFALWQLYGEAFGVPTNLTVLPNAYQSKLFGFARPTAFALEPQFFGSLLLISLLYFAVCLIRGVRVYSSSVLLFIVVTVLIIALSRGALVAAVIGLLTLFILEKVSLRKLLPVVAVGAVAVIFALVNIATAAMINDRDTTSGRTSIVKAVNQLSLGTIDLPDADTESATQNKAKSGITPSAPLENGYVASSTDSRLANSQLAVMLWKRDVTTILFGVGIGNFGYELQSMDRSAHLSAVVNNYYLEMLVELGVVGVGLFASFIGCLLFGLVRYKQWLLVSLILAFLVQWSFFSGNANVIHVWVIFAVSLGIIASRISTLQANNS